jgi:hypothetical protein
MRTINVGVLITKIGRKKLLFRVKYHGIKYPKNSRKRFKENYFWKVIPVLNPLVLEPKIFSIFILAPVITRYYNRKNIG